uniref:Uncharacterized protein n=1 Tax=Strigamia maritima TaxID=126957 RepID=T1J4F5_STRMM
MWPHNTQFTMDRNSERIPSLTGSSAHISCLYPEILALIFRFLDLRDKGRVAQVCVAWRDAAYHRSVWWGVEAKLHLRRTNPCLFQSLVQRGIRHVQVLSLRRSLREVIHGIPDLESLSLSGCYNVLDESLAQAINRPLSSLVKLNLSLCKQITDETLLNLAQYCPNLEVLDLAGCDRITNSGLLFVSKRLCRLVNLNLRSCRHVSDSGIAALGGLSSEAGKGTLQLEQLSLQDCQKLTDDALRNVSTGLVSLKYINLSFCASITDGGLKFMAKMPMLSELNLRSCDNITDLGIAYLAEGGSKITSLDVSFCDKISDQALTHVSQGLFTLRSLSMSACHISDEGLLRIARTVPELNTLNVGQCHRITDRSLIAISENLTGLQSIDLYGCTKITTVGLERIMQLPQLNSLNLGLWIKR